MVRLVARTIQLSGNLVKIAAQARGLPRDLTQGIYFGLARHRARFNMSDGKASEVSAGEPPALLCQSLKLSVAVWLKAKNV